MHGKRWLTWALMITILLIAGGTLVTNAVGVSAEGETKAEFVGTKTCRSCHMAEYKTWRKTKHAKSFNLLEGTEPKDPDCLACHTTGFGKPGGFVSKEQTPKLTNVGCESCHGPGSVHAVLAKDAPEDGKWAKRINRVPQNTCIECHNPHVSQKDRIAKLRKSAKAKAKE